MISSIVQYLILRIIPYQITFITLLFLSCSNMSHPAAPPDSHNIPLRILSLGDSYTIGTGVDAVDRFPNQLADQLRSAGLNVAEPIVVARNGWTTGELLSGIEESGIEGSFDLVTMLIGVNNQFRGLDSAEYRAQFRELLHLAVEFSSGKPSRVIVLSIPDWGVTPFAHNMDKQQIASEIDLFNQLNRQEAQAAGVHYIEITSLTRKAGNDPSLYADDLLHPSGAMYRQWAEMIMKEILPVFQK